MNPWSLGLKEEAQFVQSSPCPQLENFHFNECCVRFQILQGIASALEYLHGGWEKCILHRDIKPSNILLDSCMTARLGDFGPARLAGHTIVGNNSTGLSSTVGGTLGYVAPEVVLYGQLTKKADVYSFGMVTLEVVCGRRPQGWNLLLWLQV